MTSVNLNPDDPHSPERTAELGALFDACSRAIVYATMGTAGVPYPAAAYRLVADIYCATGRLPQLCGQLDSLMSGLLEADRLQADPGTLPPQVACARAHEHLGEAAKAAAALTRAFQAYQADITGLALKEDSDG